jgi:putative iron-dependent peroxidase
MPFGRVGTSEFGTYFIGYARSPVVIERMLTNMFIGEPPGNYDRLLDFSTAVTGNLFFVPTIGFLEASGSLSSAGAGAVPVEEAVADRALEDGSLGIGSLKGGS